MKSQLEVLHGSGISPDNIGVFEFTPYQEELLAVAEGFVSIKWAKISDYLGLAATADCVPENYDPQLQAAGRWTLTDPKKQDFVR